MNALISKASSSYRPCQHIFNATIGHSNSYNSRPRSAIVSDLNNDTRLDIAVANSGTDTVGIFLGNKDGTFQSQMTYSTGSGSQPYSMVVGDFNSDNQLDIVAANHGTNSIGILVGHGNGMFDSVRLFSLGSSRPVSATMADLNNDTHLDIVVVNYDSSSIVILLGYGNTHFSIQSKYSTGYDSHPCAVAVTDFNRDNQLDIVISNFGTNNAAVLLGYGNGSFLLQKLYSTGVGSGPSSIAVGDLNGDHQPDIAVTNYGTSTVGVLLGYGNGTFAKIQLSTIGFGYRPYAIVIGLFNKDNILDLAVANAQNDNIIVLYGLGNGTFASQETYSTSFGSTPVSVVIGDFNNDNQLDLATVNNGTNNIAVFLRYFMKMFANQVTYPTGSNSQPICVTVGDFNNDTLLDIAVANYFDNNVGIFLGYSNGFFGIQTPFSTENGSQPISIAVGDFNSDRLLDLAVANSDGNNFGILLGYGNGSFTAQTTFLTGNGSDPQSVAVGDFNNDSLLDIAVANSDGNNFGIFLGYGNGTFGMQMIFPTTSNSKPASIAVGDFNRDRLLDLAVANSGGNNLGILLGYGNGSFRAQMTFSTGNGSNPLWVAVGHFNNDSQLDIAVANWKGDNVGILLGYGDGNFEEMTTYFMGDGSKPTALAIGDFNGDNILDIAVSNSGTNNIGILFGHGDGAFGMLTNYSTGIGSRPISVATGNFNGDIWMDILVANNQGDNVGVLLGLDSRYVANQASYYSTGSGSHPYSVVTSDFNNDTLLDLMVVNSAHDNIGIRLGYGNGAFADELTYPTEANSRPYSATVGDFNNDYQMDIAIANAMSDSITVAFGDGNGTFTSQDVYPTGNNSHPNFTAVADLNNDNRLDLLILNQGTNTVGIFLSFDYATFRIQSTCSTGTLSSPNSIAVGDFNNDSLLDIAVANFYGKNVGIFLRNGNGTFGVQTTFPAENDSLLYSIAVGDFNNDGRLDLAVANWFDNVGIYLGYGNGTFGAQMIFPTTSNSNPVSVAVGDFNRDRLLDLAVANFDGNNVGILLGYGDGNFAPQTIFPAESDSLLYSVAVGDFNNDGRLDLAVANLRDNVGIYLGYGNGTFGAQMIFPTTSNSNPISIAVGDFNRDRLLDLAVTNYGGNNLGILLGYGNGSFAPQTTYSTGDGSIPIKLTVGDLNNDNIPDIVVSNNGADNVGVFFGYGDGIFTQQMTYPTGGGSQPSAVAIGDFNNDNLSDIVVANFKSNTVTIFVRDSSQPFLSMTTYSTGDDSLPQSMVIADFNNDDRLDIIVANYGKNNIGILIGYGNGIFMNQTTQTTGNGSQPRSVAVADFNNDNRSDIVVVNAGTNDIGILLGYGNDTFSPIMCYSTGDYSSPYFVAVADFNNDKWLDIIVANLGSTSVLVLFGDGHGIFERSKSYLLGYLSLPYSIAVGDFNRDSWIDIAIANYGTDNVEIRLQVCDDT